MVVIAMERFGGIFARDLEEIKGRFGTYSAALKDKKFSILFDGGDRIANARNNIEESKKLVERLAKVNARAIWPEDEEYPFLLKQLTDRPAVIYVKGKLPTTEYWLSVVGNRAMTTYGKRAVNLIIGGLSKNMVVVSGLALGVDGEAHRACLANNIPTVAVLPVGLDTIYPRTHFGLANEILAAGGALISEYPPETPVMKYQFLVRNRIVAGISQMTLVIEGAITSGSLITARLALDYSRDIGAVPGDIFSPNAVGSNYLLANGAAVVTGAEDILKLYGLDAENQPKKEYKSRIAQHCADEPKSVDMLVIALGLNYAEVVAELTTAEICGEITRTGDGMYYAS